MKAFPGTVGYAGFTLGPAHVCLTWNDLVATQSLPMPAIVVAPYLDPRQVATIAAQRVYGIVLERGSYIDPMWQELSGYNKPTILGCAGILEAAKSGDLIAVDGEQGLAVHAPDGDVLEYYKAKKGARCKRDPHWVIESIRRVADAIRGARYARGYRPPLDLPHEAGLKLLHIGRKVAGGTLPSDEDDAFVQALMTPSRVEPEELPEV